MQIVNAQIISGKKVILRLDIDVPLRLRSGSSTFFEVAEDFRLKAGIPTLNLCLQNALSVTVIGHIGRPEGKEVAELKVEPVRQWLIEHGYEEDLVNQKLILLENLRFDLRESFDSAQDHERAIEFAKELADKGDIFINEAFASYHQAASTTVLPTLLPHAAGLRFAEEVRVLSEVRNDPKKPFVAIMGGAKVADKLPVIEVLAQKADAVLIGGKLVEEISNIKYQISNIMLGDLNKQGTDITVETVELWKEVIEKAALIVWNGPLGKISNIKYQISNMGSEKGTFEIARMILESKAELVIGGGDTVSFLGKVGLLNEFIQKGFVSVGGGAMLKFLAEGTLPTIEALV
ncbi:MAG: hypothetical protein ACD_38C00031G0004 [uncultured bacterium]|uniref:Phosphoglycerate kinase n=1 Tax=Candidatus Daviesbacteria bacterium GW2011_GWC2_40_12 TaxID=1618431 RepID=A0A0G0QV94_9BACT|nr:MAG: hypothetical protein ACD_38C00031G0004 [uncultured bacterium]KKR15578.1 MAG: Phosphoglycerate kinase [Candidatus Daviesbacteria bacterium GW2011_GWA2_39_33]KKR41276.1 MAG: Phosphoglycerate kinase [Candidatus Daviesbacteria bacterium GW2011_GWC2_40_12]OGE21498.1 MAG: hypothetical protein A2778_01335 [Candidatus Daviesbacteria bacterium RIFCSPHIGHO2_01_FULL_40_24]OGE42795.1 MAG: hypothetical protein A3A53_05790 [Candidatus Daviesbacteria bacterium RIFCSPLOWO2_01_FULL_39_23]OGE66052.1 MAG